MEEGRLTLTCNYRGCRRALESVAWVTNCFHVFCNDHGSLLIKTSSECQACGTLLSEENNLVRVTLNPREYFRNMALMGLPPEHALEISRRAISFWSYQMEQEHRFQASVSKRYKEGIKITQSYYEQELRTLEGHNQALWRQLERIQQELQRIRGEKELLNEKLIENQSCQRPNFGLDPARKRIGISVIDEMITNKIPHGLATLNPQLPNPAVPTSGVAFPPMEVKLSRTTDTSPRLSHLDLAVSHPATSLGTFIQRQPSTSGMDLGKGVDSCFQTHEVHPSKVSIQHLQCSHHQQAPVIKDQELQPTSASPWEINLPSSRHNSASTQALSSVKYKEFVFAPVLQENRSDQAMSCQSSTKSF
ncbi:E3 ubiquitin-protein ligase CCNB1IP1-like [Macrobrachium rosenbergii]|uniref:E3 ubiquitin-protein ligase CCNB1IP1-like n=1 Tax=Macrobrachium rosenbergii TaxID=79674 RepID=UPI0034D6922E